MPDDRYSRQSFLGPGAQKRFGKSTVGLIGLGGGGSHIAQQLAHIGFCNYVLFDPDVTKELNLNRMVGASARDAACHRPKVEVARRTIRRLIRGARVQARQTRWQEEAFRLRGCDVVFGSVDTFAERRELEACCRRYLIPFIDIGMDLHTVENEPPVMAGQVILSLPGDLCMFCMGFLNEERLAREAANYGDVGGRPQVVWPNGVLASTAVGIAVDLLTDWSKSTRSFVYLSYDGRTGTIREHARVPYLAGLSCNHYPLYLVGEPRFQEL